MVDKELSELISKVADAMYEAAQTVLDEAQALLDEAYEELKSLDSDVAETGGSEEPSPEQKYQYIVDHTSNQVLKEVYKGALVKEYLLSDPEALDRLYVQIQIDEVLKTDNWNH